MTDARFDYSRSSHHSQILSDLYGFKALPKALEAERAVLGAALLEPDEVIPKLREALAPTDFYERRHQRFFETMLALHDQGTPVTEREIIDLLEREKRLNECGELPASYLTDLRVQCPGVATLDYYIDKLKEAARRREVAVRLLVAYEKAKTDPDAALEELIAQARLDKLADTSPNGASLVAFPQSAFLGIAGDFAQLYSQYLESPPQFLFMTFLTYLGAILADKITIASELRPQPRLYTVLLGESANSRKSSALDIVDSFFREVFAVNVHYGLGSAEGLAAEIESEDGSPRSLILHCDELKLLVDKASQDGSIALPMLTTLFERNVFDNTTKGRKIRVRNGYLSLVSACTTETYQRMWHPSFRDIGFINRLFLVHGDAKRRHFSPKPVPESERRRLQEELVGLVGAITATAAARKRPIEMVFDPEAEAVLQDWYMKLSSSVHERRLEVYGLRLCILLEVSQGETRRITRETALAVRDILEYELAVRRLYDPIDADNAIARVEESIRRVLATYGPMRERDLKRRVNYQRVGIWAYNTALENLLKSGEVRFNSSKKLLGLVGCHQECHQVSKDGKNAE